MTSGSAILVVAVANASANAVGSFNKTRSVVLSNPAGAGVYLGSSGVTSGTGYLLPAATTVTLSLFPSDVVYAIAASSTQVVSYFASGG